jgi:hypothetical protein
MMSYFERLLKERFSKGADGHMVTLLRLFWNVVPMSFICSNVSTSSFLQGKGMQG